MVSCALHEGLGRLFSFGLDETVASLRLLQVTILTNSC